MPLPVSGSLCWLAIYLFPLYALEVWVGFSWRDLSYIINVVANVLSTTYVKWKLDLPHHTSCIPQNDSCIPKQMIGILFPSFSLSTCRVLERSSNQHWPCVYQLLSDHCHLFKSEAMLTNANILPVILYSPWEMLLQEKVEEPCECSSPTTSEGRAGVLGTHGSHWLGPSCWSCCCYRTFVLSRSDQVV